jgi:hypothetical protein
MNNLIIILFVVLLSYPALAQEETLFSGAIVSGGYGGPLIKIGQINGEMGVFLGGQGGWIINHRLVLGGKGYGLVNDVAAEGSQNLKLVFGCGGGLLEYIIASNKLLHFTIHSLIGAGGVGYAEKDYDDDNDKIDYSGDGFFVFEPGINIILNVHKYLRIGAGATYRYVNGVDYENLSNADLSGVSTRIFFKFGEF